jgi:hypothetical protein
MPMLQHPAAAIPGTVSYTLALTVRARRAAARAGLPAALVVRAAVGTYRRTGNALDGIRALRDAAGMPDQDGAA